MASPGAGHAWHPEPSMRRQPPILGLSSTELHRRSSSSKLRPCVARVFTALLLPDLNVVVDRQDDRRLEVIANGLPLWGGVQLAVDTTLVSPHADSVGLPFGTLALPKSERTPNFSAPLAAVSLSSPSSLAAGGALRPLNSFGFWRAAARAPHHLCCAARV